MEVERVQALASHHELPSHFIRAAHERPENSKALEGAKVPVISLSQPHHLLVKEISEASKEWGFFVIKDHGVSPDLIKKVEEVGVGFFEQPQEVKEKYSNDPSKGNFEGYGTKMINNTDHKVEWLDYYFHLMAPPSKVNHAVWPQNPPNYREVTEGYNKEVMRLQDEILRLLSEGLGLEKETLRTRIGGDDIEVEMKINMYPPCPQPELVLGVEAHSDMSALTVLVTNDVLGLQCWKGGNWIAVDYFPDGIYIHVGDQVEEICLWREPWRRRVSSKSSISTLNEGSFRVSRCHLLGMPVPLWLRIFVKHIQVSMGPTHSWFPNSIDSGHVIHA